MNSKFRLLLGAALICCIANISGQSRQLLCGGRAIYGALVADPGPHSDFDYTITPIADWEKGLFWDCYTELFSYCYYYRVWNPVVQWYEYIPCPEAEHGRYISF